MAKLDEGIVAIDRVKVEPERFIVFMIDPLASSMLQWASNCLTEAEVRSALADLTHADIDVMLMRARQRSLV